MENERKEGVVLFFKAFAGAGHGLLTPNDGSEEVFISLDALTRAKIPTLTAGQKVSFEVHPPQKQGARLIAQNLKLIP